MGKQINGTPWHIQSIKGYNETYKKCFNCYYFDNNSCNKKNIHISANNAKFCNDFLKNQDIELLNKNISIHINKDLNKVEYTDIVIIENLKNKKTYKIKVEKGDNTLINSFIDSLVGKSINKTFSFESLTYYIKKIEKDSKEIIDFPEDIILNHEIYVQKLVSQRKQYINKQNLRNQELSRRKKLRKQKQKETPSTSELIIKYEKAIKRIQKTLNTIHFKKTDLRYITLINKRNDYLKEIEHLKKDIELR